MKNEIENYDFGLDLTSNNSRKLVNDFITENSLVLEFGPAGGDLTKYLNESKHCQIDIVEIDLKTGQKAAQYARNALLGEKEGNIENYYWEEKYHDNTYDYILFSDVLEHLYNPWEVLKRCKKLLKPDGSVILSIPNIANNNIILNLLRDRFNYTSWGLLDNTHIRFFTINSLEEMIENAGFVPVKRFATYAPAGACEINVNYDMFDKSDTNIIKMHLLGNIYQFVYEVKCKRENIDNQKNLKSFYYNNETYNSSIFIDCGNDFSEQLKVRSDLHITEDGHFIMSFNLEGYHGIHRLRFDPLEGIKIILLLNSIQIDGQEYEPDWTNCNLEFDNNYVYFGEDPQVGINNISGKVSTVTIDGFIYTGKEYYDKLSYFTNVMNHTLAAEKERNLLLQNERTALIDERVALLEYNNKLKDERALLKKNNKELTNERKVLIKQLNEKGRNIVKLNRDLQNIKNGWSFKLGRAITYLPRKIKSILFS